jgi:hypothetical protein
MAVNIEQGGEFQVIYGGPYGGFHTMMPENLLPDNFSPATNDFIFRNAELRTRPIISGSGITAPVALAKVIAVGNIGNLIFAVSQGNGLYTTTNGTVWTFVPGSSAVTGTYITTRVFGGVLYIAVGSHLASYDGTTFTLDNATLAAGPTNIGGVFLDELDNHLILANTSEHAGASTSLLGNRIRWSATGLPNQWDPTANVNAGFNDFLDIPDGITGLMMLGRVGYLLRTDGITEIGPTGRGQAPFEFNHMWASKNGIGNIKFFGQAQYGTTGVIIARDNIYSILSYQVQSIGGGARDQIYSDMSLASAATGGVGGMPNIWGAIVPYIFSGVVPDAVQTSGSGGSSTAFSYLMYMLFLNIGNNCKVWIYSFDENNWTPWNLPNMNVTAQPQLAVNPAGQQVLLIPRITPSNGATDIAAFTPGVGNDIQASHSYKVEDIIANYFPTVRRVILTYRDVGIATITVTVSGVDDLGVPVTASQTVTIGTAGAPGILKTKFVDLQMSGFRPQLTITRPTNGGPLAISTSTMIGHVEKVAL